MVVIYSLEFCCKIFLASGNNEMSYIQIDFATTYPLLNNLIYIEDQMKKKN